MKTCGFKKSSLMMGMVALIAAAFTLPAFGASVKEKTNGKIDIATFPAGQLGGERSMAEQMQAGMQRFFPPAFSLSYPAP